MAPSEVSSDMATDEAAKPGTRDHSNETMSKAQSALENDVLFRVDADEDLEYVIDNCIIGDPSAEDRNFIENEYEKAFLEFLPKKSVTFFRGLVDNAESTPEANSFCFEWLNAFVSGTVESRLETFCKYLEEIQQKNKFLINLITVCKLSRTRPNGFNEILSTLSENFFQVFDDKKELKGELGIYRCLRCSKGTPRTKDFCEAIQILWQKCINPRETVSIVAQEETVKKTELEHHKLLDIAEKLPTPYRIEQELVVKTIRAQFAPLTHQIIFAGRNAILEFRGVEYEVSKTMKHMQKYLAASKDICEIRMIASDTIVVDVDLKLPEKNVALVAATKIRVAKTISWDLSGADALVLPNFQYKAANGQSPGSDGADGEHGKSGTSSGHLYVRTKAIEKSELWSVYLCGGKGARGQDGGDGCDGENGVGRKYEEVFPLHKLTSLRLNLTVDTAYGGSFTRLARKLGDRLSMNDIEKDGVKHILNRSNHYASIHFFEAYLGTKGKPGGRSGRHGLGGGGGKRGTFIVLVPTGARLENLINVTSKDGENGHHGVDGTPGRHGFDGQDVVAACTIVQSWQDFGTKSNDKKVTIKFSNDSSQGYYVPERYEGEGSLCYIQATDVRMRSRKIAEAKLNKDERRESERKAVAEVRAIAPIDSRAIEEQYADIFMEKSEEKKVVENREHDVDADVEIHRLVSHTELPPEPPYAPKLRPPLPILTATQLEEIATNDAASLTQLWSTPVDAFSQMNIQKLLQNTTAKKQALKMRQKLFVTRLRQKKFGEVNIQPNQWAENDRETQNLQLVLSDEEQREAFEIEGTERDCFRFLAPCDDSLLNVHPCLVAMFNTLKARDCIIAAIDEGKNVLLTPQTFQTLHAIYMKQKSLRLHGKPIIEFLAEFREISHVGAEPGSYRTNEERDAIKTQLIKQFDELINKSSEEEKQEIAKLWEAVKKDLEQFDFTKDESASEYPLTQIRLASVIPQFAVGFVRIHHRLETNWTIALACHQIFQLVNEEFMREDRESFSDEQKVVMMWLKRLEGAQERKKQFEAITRLAQNCSAGRLLIAWRTKANIRIYESGTLIEDHFKSGSQTFHIEIADGKYRWLNFEKNRLNLLRDRQRQTVAFVNELSSYKEGNPIASLNLLSTTKVDVCSNCASEKPCDQTEVLLNMVCEIVRQVGGDDALKDDLELFITEYPQPGNIFLAVLYTIFNVDGTHIDFEDLSFILKIAQQTCDIGGAHEWSLGYLLLTTSQNEWLEAFFVLGVENVLMRKLLNKQDIFLAACRAIDKRTLILIREKLLNESTSLKEKQIRLNELELLRILQHIRHAKTAYPEVSSVPLQDWVNILQESYIFYLLRDKCQCLPEEVRNRYTQWCAKISDAFGPNEAENVVDLLLEKQFVMKGRERAALGLNGTTMLINNESLSALIQCICNRELETSYQHSPTTIFQVLCASNLDYKLSRSASAKIQLSKNARLDAEKALMKFCIPYRAPILRILDRIFGRSRKVAKQAELMEKRSIQAIIQLMINNNAAVIRKAAATDEANADEQQRINLNRRLAGINDEIANKRKLLFVGLERSLTTRVELKEQLARELLDKEQMPNQKGEKTRPMKFYDKVKAVVNERIGSGKQNADTADMCNEVLMAVLDLAVFRKRNYWLRNNQKVAILLALRSGNISQRGVLQEIATGEGKSLLITCLAIISVLKGESVHILSSSSTLAKRDTESDPPTGCTDIYELFGVTAGHICVESSYQRREVYAKCDVVYGDISSFQRDYLLDKFYAKNITGNRKFGTIIIDEVDSMLLDQGNNMLYLSHEIPELEFLQPLFVRIWQTICAAVVEDSAETFKTETIVNDICQSIFPTLSLDTLNAELGIDESKAVELQILLINRAIIDERGRILTKSVMELQQRLQLQTDTQMVARLSFCIQEILKRDFLSIPEHLKGFVEAHLEEFVENAKTAYFMEEGCGYQVDVLRSDVGRAREMKIVIVDQSTGVDLLGTQWSNGLHQFLQLKHCLRLTSMSLKAVFISNVTFIAENYKQIYGFSGTLGAEAEQVQLMDLYRVDCVRLPSSLPRRLHEDKTVVTISDDEHVKRVYEAILSKLENKRSTLVICETIRQVDKLSAEVKKLALQNLADDDKNRDSFNNMILYRRDRDDFEYGSGKTKLHCGQIIFSTNLAGRGTDIKLTDELIANGGLHVIVAFLPINVRIEEQAFGRAARCGEPGTAQLVILNKKEGHDRNIALLKMQRNTREAKRVFTITKFYKQNICVEEECFSAFTQRFNDETRKITDEEGRDDKEKHLLQRDLLDRWAIWLDEKAPKSEEIDAEYGEKLTEEAREFCKTLEFPNRKPLQPLNRLRWGIEFLMKEESKILARLRKKDYQSALEDFNYIEEKYPFFSAEAKYYKGYIIIKQNHISGSSHENFRELRSHYRTARHNFDARARQCYSDRAIVDHYKKDDRRRHFVIDIFSRQQMELAHLYQMFTASIDRLLGTMLSYEDFMSTFVKEEIAFAAFEKFCDPSIFGVRPVTTLCFAKPDPTADVSDFATAHCMSAEVACLKLDGLRNETENLDQKINALFPVPTREAFWEELQELGCLKEVREHALVNKGRFTDLHPQLVQKIEETIRTSPESRMWLHLNDPSAFCEIDSERLSNLLSSAVFANLVAMKVIIQTKSAEFDAVRDICRDTSSSEDGSASHRVENFKAFSCITQNDLVEAGISTSDAKLIIDELVRAKVLVADGLRKFRLRQRVNLDSAKIPRCYTRILVNLLKQRCAFVLAYRDIREAVKRDELPRISMPSADDAQRQVFDLVEAGIIECSNVNLKGLKSSLKIERDVNIARKAFDSVTKSDDELNIRIILEDVSTTYNNAVREHQTADFNDDSMKKSAVQPYDESKGNAIIQHLLQAFLESSGIEQFETVDANLAELSKRLVDAGLHQVRAYCLYANHGPSHIIDLTEKPWSKKSMWKISGVLFIAAAELTVGGVLLIGTAGMGVVVANASINEGIGDLLYCVQGLYSGHPGSYKKHKLISLACTAAFCGPAAWAARGQLVNPIAYALRGGGYTVKTAAGATANFATLKGSALLAEVGLNQAAKVAAAQVGRRVATAFISVGIFNALQWASDSLVKRIVEEIRNRAIASAEKSLNAGDLLRTQIRRALTILGPDGGARLSQDCFNYVVIEGGIDGLSLVFDAIFVQYRPVILSFVGGVAQNTSYASTYGAIEETIRGLVTGSMAVKCFKDIGDRIEHMTRELTALLTRKLDQAEEANDDFRSPSDASGNEPVLDSRTASLIKQWHEKKIDSMIQSRFINPTLMLATSFIQEKMQTLAQKAYSSIKEGREMKQIDRFEKEFEKEKLDKNIGENEANKRREAKLTELMMNTRNPKVIRRLINAGVKTEMGIAAASANILAQKYKQSVIVRIKTDTGESFEHRAEGENPSVKVFEIDLKNQHYGRPVKENESFLDICWRLVLRRPPLMRNQCLYEELCRQDKEIRQFFADNSQFRKELADAIVNDPYFRIYKGWHSISVQRKLIGGEDEEYLKCRASIKDFENAKEYYQHTNDFDTVEWTTKKVQTLARQVPGIPMSEAELNSVLRGGSRSQAKLKDHLRKEMNTKFDRTGRSRDDLRRKCASLLQALEKLYNSRQTFDVVPDFYQGDSTATLEPRVENVYQRLCNEIIISLANCDAAREEPTTEKRSSSFAAFTMVSNAASISTVFIASNFYSMAADTTKTKKTLSQNRCKAIVDQIKADHPQLLSTCGIKSITFVMRDTKGLAQEFAASRKKAQAGQYSSRPGINCLDGNDHWVVEHSVPVEMLAQFTVFQHQGALISLAVSRRRCQQCPSLDADNGSSPPPTRLADNVQTRARARASSPSASSSNAQDVQALLADYSEPDLAHRGFTVKTETITL